MPSFDVVNKVDQQEVDNALNNTTKEMQTRYDLRQGKSTLEFSKKDMKIHIVADDEMKLRAIREIVSVNFTRRKIDPKCLEHKPHEPTSNGMVKADTMIKEGIETETGKKIVKAIKEAGLKVQASIGDSQVRVTGKKIDDLQEVMALLRGKDFGIPLQFVNLKRD
jgi:cyclic-di-GMP-binding protein